MEPCKACGGFGWETLTGCPRKMVTAETNDAVDWYMRLDDKGITPITGGWLDQSAVYVDAMDELRAAISKAREQKRGRNGN